MQTIGLLLYLLFAANLYIGLYVIAGQWEAIQFIFFERDKLFLTVSQLCGGEVVLLALVDQRGGNYHCLYHFVQSSSA